METVASPEVSAKDVDMKEMTPAVIEEIVTEAPTPVVVQPSSTSPKPSFACEVRVGAKPLILKNKIKKIMYTLIQSLCMTGPVENHPDGGPESDC